MTLPIALEQLAGQLREATRVRARARSRQRRLRLLALSLAGLATLGSVAAAGGWLGGSPAPDPVKRALRAELRTSSAQVRSLVGAPIADEAIVAASLDSRHFVWGAPTTTGGYCVGVTGPHSATGAVSCSGAAAGMWGSYYDCDGSVIIGGRIAGLARPTARFLEIRHDGETLSIPLDPAHHGFFIARLPARLFRGVESHTRRTYPRAVIADAHHRAVPPARVNGGWIPPPSSPAC